MASCRGDKQGITGIKGLDGAGSKQGIKGCKGLDGVLQGMHSVPTTSATVMITRPRHQACCREQHKLKCTASHKSWH